MEAYERLPEAYTSHRLLSAKEEKALADLPEKEYRAEIARHCLRLVVSVANKYKDRGIPFPDLVEEGCVGLMESLKTFKPKKEYRVSTYVTDGIHHKIKQALADKSRTVRVPAYLNEEIGKWRRTADYLRQTWNREPTTRELAKYCEIDAKRYELFLSALMLSSTTRQLVSIDDMCNDDTDGGTTFSETLEDKKADTVGYIERKEEDNELYKALARIGKRDAEIIKMRYGFNGHDEMTLQEIGDKIGLSRERVRQIESEALQKLSRMMGGNVTPKRR